MSWSIFSSLLLEAVNKDVVGTLIALFCFSVVASTGSSINEDCDKSVSEKKSKAI